MDWLDLLREGDPHPRRFDSLESLEAHLRRVERLDEDALAELLLGGRVDPPLALRSYRIRPLRRA
ncbi:hypothetical protein ACFP81_00400 [Deinococcus lacus]|uniref:Uncharacterized protein n=1 Tax=Deinococcus lacus TaxID=392561 RepID=A0ABW1Y8Z2_9DEIO